jgi:uncharacterized protein
VARVRQQKTQGDEMVHGKQSKNESGRNESGRSECAVDVGASDRALRWREQCQANWGVPKPFDASVLFRADWQLNGAVGLMAFDRLLDDLPEQPIVRGVQDIPKNGTGAVWFEVAVKQEVGRRPRLHLVLQSHVLLTCQRCLQQMVHSIDESVVFELLRHERKHAEQTDEAFVDPKAPEELILEDLFDVGQLVEDQLILAIPYVPRHEDCSPQAPYVQSEGEVEKVSPFYGLEKLKRH